MKKLYAFKSLFLVLMVLGLGSRGWGQLTTNTFTGASNCPTNGNTFSAVSNATVTPFTRNTITCNATANVFNSTTLNATSSRDNASYLEFSITANAGFTLNLTSLSFLRQASNTAPNSLIVSYSTDAANFNTTRVDMAPSTSPTSGTTLTWNFPSAIITGNGGTVTFRFYPFGTQRADLVAGAASASGTFRLDDVSLSGTVNAVAAPTPTTTVSTTSLTDFGNVNVGSSSSSKSFTVSGANLTANVTVAAPTHFEVSADNVTFASSITLAQSGGTLTGQPVTVYARFTPTSTGAKSGNITLNSTGATQKTVSVSGTGTSPNSASSNIISATSFTTPSNIAYNAYQATDLTAANSIEVARFTIQDGGGSSDADALATILNQISFTVVNSSLLRRIALYDGSTELAEIASASTASFTGLTLTAPDNGSKDFSIRVSFVAAVTDNQQFSFTVSSTATDASGSQMATSNAGAAASSTLADNNRIEVSADRLAFVVQPTDVNVNTAISPAVTVSANDINGNRDLDYVTNITVTTTGTFAAAATTTITPVSGLGTFDNLQFSQTGTITLSANSGSLTTATSGSFVVTAAPSLTEIILPQFISGLPSGTTNNDRTLFAYRVRLNNLLANATYRYYNQAVISNDAATADGAGNPIFYNSAGSFIRSSSPGINSAGNYSTFITDGTGSYTGWFFTEPTGNSRFLAGNTVNMRIMLNDGASGTTVATRLGTTSGVTVLAFGTTGTNTGTGIRGSSFAVAKDVVFLYDNVSGMGRPISGTLVESDGLDLPDANYADFTDNGSVDGVSGAWGTIIPNALSNGIKRIDFKNSLNGNVRYAATDADGNWAGTINTVNPSGGTSAVLVIPTTKADGFFVSSNTTVISVLDINDVLDVNNSATFTTGGFVTLKSTSTVNTARVGPVTGTISGNVTVERYIPAKRAFRFLSFPVTSTQSYRTAWMEGQNNTTTTANSNTKPGYGTHITGTGGTTNGFDQTATNAASLFTFDNGVSQAYIAAANANTTGVYVLGKGYRLLVRGSRAVDLTNNTATASATILEVLGSLYTGTFTFNASSTVPLSTTANGYSFIGNPYASPISWNSLAKTNISGTYYAYDPNINAKGAFVSYNGITNSIASSQVDDNIQSGEAFFVQTLATSTATSLVFNEANKTVTTRSVFKSSDSLTTLSVRLLLNSASGSQNTADGAKVLFDNTFSNNIGKEDSYKISNVDENLAINHKDTQLSIEGRASVVVNDSVNFKIWQFRQSKYILRLDGSYFEPSTTAILKDTYLHTETPVNLADSTLIPFSITTDSASFAADRFMVIFKSSATLPVTVTNVTALTKGKGIQVNWISQSEVNIDRYEIEKSLNGQVFQKATAIKAKGNNTVADNYTWFDENPVTGTNYYRIKVIEKSGAIAYTQIVRVAIDKAGSSMAVYPNPVKSNTINLHLVNMDKGRYTVTLYNNIGQKIYTTVVDHTGASATYAVKPGKIISKGTYQLHAVNGGKVTNTMVIFE